MATCSQKEFSPQARRAAGSDASLHRRRAAVRSFRSKTAAAGVAAVLTRRPRLAAARQHAGWRCCCRLETLPACSISSTRAARRAASRAPTGFGQADAARARSVGSVTTDSPASSGRFDAVLVSWAYSITRDDTSHMHLCVLSLSALLYGFCTSLLGQSMPNPRSSPPRARPRRAPARRRASPPSSARARSATAWFVLASTSLTPHTHTPHTNANRNTRIFSTLTPP